MVTSGEAREALKIVDTYCQERGKCETCIFKKACDQTEGDLPHFIQWFEHFDEEKEFNYDIIE